ncbi:hypothetical protein GP486_007143 [Trichoglossum hirsutum]|uniref:Uncharacterized protein n=1 Tax=Trichoglossum hirsutum TaxID=265104 RepID=A0A9P8L318_9PEZI|nr:hypothetical protein GP486_007143 [Trichoglossum hirsutum]
MTLEVVMERGVVVADAMTVSCCAEGGAAGDFDLVSSGEDAVELCSPLAATPYRTEPNEYSEEEDILFDSPPLGDAYCSPVSRGENWADQVLLSAGAGPVEAASGSAGKESWVLSVPPPMPRVSVIL